MEEEKIGRPLSNGDIAKISASIVKPKDADDLMFADVLKNIMSQRINDIRGIEDRGEIKAILQRREIEETERLARMNTKLTMNEKRIRMYPSAYNDALPKFFLEEEIPLYLEKKTKEIQKLINQIFTPLKGGITSLEKEKEEEVPLSEEEIERALNSMDYELYFRGDKPNIMIDRNISRAAFEFQKREMELQLRRVKLKPSRVNQFIEDYKLKFLRSLARPGKYVGSIAASTYGESATQQTLNTFHAAGDRNARKQVNAFAKFEAIVEVKEKSQHPTITIFLKRNYNEEQIRTKIPIFQSSMIKDLIEDYRILGDRDGLPPKPRWEIIHEAIYGIDNSNIRNPIARKNLHRGNPDFQGPDARILEIKFRTSELFFRRISLGTIATAIEQYSNDIRVATSSLDIGLIYIYYKAPGLGNGKVPEEVLRDKNAYALKKILLPKILEYPVSGILGLDYVVARNYEISKAIDDGNSYIMKTQPGIMYLKFKENNVYRWGLTEDILKNFVQTKLNRFAPPGHEYRWQYDIDKTMCSFNYLGLEWYDYEENRIKLLSEKEIFKELKGINRIPVYELLNHPSGSRYAFGQSRKNDVEFKPLIDPKQRIGSIYASGLDGVDILAKPMKENKTKGEIVLDFSKEKMDNLGMDLESLAKILEGSFSAGAENLVTASVNPDRSQILLSNLNSGDMSLEAFMEKELKEIYNSSPVLVEAGLRWYLEAEGSNFKELMAHPEVDTKYTITDNPLEVYSVLGVEACRSVLVWGITDNVKADMNPVHIELLADSMTYRTPAGKPLSQTRHGMAKRNAEFVSRMFETTTAVLMESGLGGVDNINSFTSKIMMGTLSKTRGLAEEDRIRVLQKAEPLDSAYKNQEVFRYDFPIQKSLKLEAPTKMEGTLISIVQEPTTVAQPGKSMEDKRKEYQNRQKVKRTLNKPQPK